MRKRVYQYLYLTIILAITISLNIERFSALALSLEGLAANGNQMWQQGTGGIDGSAESSDGTSGVGFYRAGDNFGRAVAVGDFNKDGYADLVVGVPGEDASGFVQVEGGGNSIGRGAINVIYGTTSGLSSSGDQLWQQGNGGIPGAAEEGDEFGAALSVGDYNGDSYDDLAIGISGEDSVESELGHPHEGSGKGAVAIMYGSPSGLGDNSSERGIPNQLFYQDVDGIEGVGERDDQYGAALASGDFDHDGYDDLAIGVPGEDNDDGNAGGAVAVLYGSLFGLSARGDQLWDQESEGISGSISDGDEFGAALAAGDFDKDGYDDLAIGIPGEDGGKVTVLNGTASGLSSSGSSDWSLENGRFGAALAAGDFNNDGYDDLAAGAPDSDIPGDHGSRIRECGSVVIIKGSRSGLTSDDSQTWDQNGSEGSEFNLRGGAEPHDNFGASLTAGDFNGDGNDDLAIGIPNEDITEDNDGAVAVIYGTTSGLRASGNQMWDQNGSEDPDIYNLEGGSEKDDNFGRSLAAGDFDGDSIADLAIGVPFEDGDAGAVSVIYGTGNHAPTAEAGGPYQVDKCRSVVLDATQSSDPDPGTEFIYSWDLDGDGIFGEGASGGARGDERGPHPRFVPDDSSQQRTWVLVSLKVGDGFVTRTDQAMILINDPPPTLSCPSNITRSTDPGQCQAVVTLSAPAAMDNCPGAVVTSTRSDGRPLDAPYEKGQTQITWEATDNAGQTATCQQTVTVVDSEAPSIICPPNLTVVAERPGDQSVAATFRAPSFTDNCPGASVTCNPPSGADFPVGVTTVTCTVKDQADNRATCSFTVTVFDVFLQDDSNPAIVLMFNSFTGDYRFCCSDTTYSGRGIVDRRGVTFALDHTTTDRRLHAVTEPTLYRGSAHIKSPIQIMRGVITDRDTRNNTGICEGR